MKVMNVEDLKMLTKITETLNELGSENAAGGSNYFLKVQLLSGFDGSVVGEWTDEHGEANWHYEASE